MPLLTAQGLLKERMHCNDFLICSGPLWATLRHNVQPMFHTHPLTAYAETINEAVDQLLDNLNVVADSGTDVNLVQQLSQLTMQVIGAAAFG